MKGNILVTGGLGFIGSHTVVCLHEAGYKPVIVDNLNNSRIGVLSALTELIGYEPLFYEEDVLNQGAIEKIILENQVSAVIHFAAYKAVGESVEKPLMYYRNNVGGLISELPLGVPNNLIPYLTQTVAGIRECLTVHGGDYDTPDGSCIRDYIHVMDLADAHVAAVDRLFAKSAGMLNDYGVAGVSGNDNSNGQFELFNIGTGNGSSVLEVIQAFEDATGKKVPHVVGPRRAGDVVAVWADTKKVNDLNE